MVINAFYLINTKQLMKIVPINAKVFWGGRLNDEYSIFHSKGSDTWHKFKQINMSNATSTNYFTTFLQNVDVINFLLVFN